jgi:hypothetical protein
VVEAIRLVLTGDRVSWEPPSRSTMSARLDAAPPTYPPLDRGDERHRPARGRPDRRWRAAQHGGLTRVLGERRTHRAGGRGSRARLGILRGRPAHQHLGGGRPRGAALDAVRWRWPRSSCPESSEPGCPAPARGRAVDRSGRAAALRGRLRRGRARAWRAPFRVVDRGPHAPAGPPTRSGGASTATARPG